MKSLKKYLFILIFWIISINLIILFLVFLDKKQNSNTNQNINFHYKICKYPQFLIQIENYAICVEIADSPEERQKGLMFRNQLNEDEGFLFIFDEAEFLNFWMKNTYIDLDIAFFNEKAEFLEYWPMKALSTELIRSSQKALYALEVNKGWFQKNPIPLGSKIIFHF